MKSRVPVVALTFALAVALTSCGSSNNMPVSGSSSSNGTSPGGTNPPSGGGTSGAGGGGSPAVTAHVYVGTGNALGVGTGITAFAVHSDGSADAVPGSPFSGPSRDVVSNGTFVFATDGTNIIGYTRAADGSLTQSSSTNAVSHNQFPGSSDVVALTLDHTGQTLYAAELNAGGTENDAYAFFNVSNGTPVYTGQTPQSTYYDVPLAFSANNAFAYGSGCFFINW